MVTGASLNANFKYNLEEITIGVSAYDSADMLIGDVGEFLNREFVNFRTAGSVTPADNNTYYDVDLDYSKFREESDKILLAFKKSGSNATYVYDPRLTISYVQKNPGLTDSTLKEIRIDGVALEGFDPKVTEYYVGIENPEGVHEITAVPSYEESTVTVSGNTITVTPVIGESRVYTINLRELKTLTVTASDNKRLKWNGQTKAEYLGPSSIDPTSSSYTTYGIEQDMVMYQLFDLTALPENAVITDAEIVCDVYDSAVAPTTIYWNRSVYDTFEAIPTSGYHKEFSGKWTDARKPVLLGSFTIAETVAYGTHTAFTSKLDASKLNIVNNKIVLAATKAFGEENSDSMAYMTPKSDMTIKYIVK